MSMIDSEILPLPKGSAQVHWRRSANARRISLRIDPCGGAVVVTLPMRAGRAAGMALVMDHADWICSRLAELPTHLPFADGASVPVHGMLHRIEHVPGRAGARIEDGVIRVTGDPEFLTRRVRDLLRAEAQRKFSLTALEKCAKLERRPRRVTVKDTRTRWGSCTPDGVLMFSWRLIMAPDFVQDYVIAHEAAHMVHMNHSARFWRQVAELTPHSRAAIAWLHDDGASLLRIG